MKKSKRCLPVVLLALLGSIGNVNAETYIRKDASTPAAQADLEALKVAMAKMKKTGCDDPLSWYYQGGMHWTPDPTTLTKPKSNPYCASFNAQNTALKWAWNTCASHDAQDNSEIHFLAWHRLYVYHLEKIVRKLSGKQDFALPYWNYVSFDPANKPQLVMPEPFRLPAVAYASDKQTTPFNSLYTAARLDSLNQGQPIADTQNNENRKDATEIFTDGDYKTFNSGLNHSIHDNMHVYIGGPGPMFNEIEQTETVGLMGDIPSAAFDPIFWMHHGNIDRLFQQWTDSIHGQKITMEDLTSVVWPYDFYDENGKKVTYTMKQVYDILYNLDYRYDNQTTAPTLMAKAPGKPKETKILSQAVNKAFSASGAQFGLSLPKAAIPVKALTAELKAPAKSIVLELEVSYDDVPKGRYEVYVNLPNSKLDVADKDKYYAGAMHFFVAKPHAGQKGRRVFRYDLTDELSDAAVLGGEAKDNNQLNFSIFGIKGNTAVSFTVDKATVYTYEK